jgi:hypothetical protein
MDQQLGAGTYLLVFSDPTNQGGTYTGQLYAA